MAKDSHSSTSGSTSSRHHPYHGESTPSIQAEGRAKNSTSALGRNAHPLAGTSRSPGAFGAPLSTDFQGRRRFQPEPPAAGLRSGQSHQQPTQCEENMWEMTNEQIPARQKSLQKSESKEVPALSRNMPHASQESSEGRGQNGRSGLRTGAQTASAVPPKNLPLSGPYGNRELPPQPRQQSQASRPYPPPIIQDYQRTLESTVDSRWPTAQAYQGYGIQPMVESGPTDSDSRSDKRDSEPVTQFGNENSYKGYTTISPSHPNIASLTDNKDCVPPGASDSLLIQVLQQKEEQNNTLLEAKQALQQTLARNENELSELQKAYDSLQQEAADQAGARAAADAELKAAAEEHRKALDDLGKEKADCIAQEAAERARSQSTCDSLKKEVNSSNEAKVKAEQEARSQASLVANLKQENQELQKRLKDLQASDQQSKELLSSQRKKLEYVDSNTAAQIESLRMEQGKIAEEKGQLRTDLDKALKQKEDLERRVQVYETAWTPDLHSLKSDIAVLKARAEDKSPGIDSLLEHQNMLNREIESLRKKNDDLTVQARDFDLEHRNLEDRDERITRELAELDGEGTDDMELEARFHHWVCSYRSERDDWQERLRVAAKDIDRQGYLQLTKTVNSLENDRDAAQTRAENYQSEKLKLEAKLADEIGAEKTLQANLNQKDTAVHVAQATIDQQTALIKDQAATLQQNANLLDKVRKENVSLERRDAERASQVEQLEKDAERNRQTEGDLHYQMTSLRVDLEIARNALSQAEEKIQLLNRDLQEAHHLLSTKQSCPTASVSKQTHEAQERIRIEMQQVYGEKLHRLSNQLKKTENDNKRLKISKLELESRLANQATGSSALTELPSSTEQEAAVPDMMPAVRNTLKSNKSTSDKLDQPFKNPVISSATKAGTPAVSASAHKRKIASGISLENQGSVTGLESASDIQAKRAKVQIDDRAGDGNSPDVVHDARMDDDDELGDEVPITVPVSQKRSGQAHRQYGIKSKAHEEDEVSDEHTDEDSDEYTPAGSSKAKTGRGTNAARNKQAATPSAQQNKKATRAKTSAGKTAAKKT